MHLQLGMMQDHPFADPIERSRTDLVAITRARAVVDAEKTAYTFWRPDEGTTASVTFGEIDQTARRIGGMLQERGLAGAPVLLLYPPGLEFICAFYGALYAGALPVPTFPPDPNRLDRTLPRLAAIAADCGARAILTDSAVSKLESRLGDVAPALRAAEWLATDSAAPGLEAAWTPPLCAAPDAPAFIQYTSGSTRDPRGVVLTHGNLVANVAEIHDRFGTRSDQKGVFWLPLYHDMGLIGGVIHGVCIGNVTHWMSPIDFLRRPLRWLEHIGRVGARVSGAPNFAYDLCVRKTSPEERAQLDLRSWSVAFSGSETVRSDTLRRFAEAFEVAGFRPSAFLPCYGLAESTLMVSGGQSAEGPRTELFDLRELERGSVRSAAPGAPGALSLVSAGPAIDGHEVRIVDPETLATCAEDEIGEIWIAGPSVARGYWRDGGAEDEGATRFGARSGDGAGGHYLRTGDLGFVRNGELYVTGRRKDSIVIRGRNHAPTWFERTAEAADPSLRPGCVAAFSVSDGATERLVIVAEIADPANGAPASAIRRRVGAAVIREHGVVLSELVPIRRGSIPKTSSGKLRRAACRDAYLRKALEAVDPGPPAAVREGDPEREDGTESEWLRAFPGWLGEVLGAAPDPFDPDVDLADLGVDSLHAVELLEVVARATGATLPTDRLSELGTPRRIVRAASAERTVREPAPRVPAARKRSRGRHRQVHLTARTSVLGTYRALERQFGLPASGRRDPFGAFVAVRSHLEEHGAVPWNHPCERVSSTRVRVGGRDLTIFSSYSYLGLLDDPRIKQAAIEACAPFGTGAHGVRMLAGDLAVHRELERRTARFLDREAALVFSSGFLANVGVLSGLIGPDDYILIDALSHVSLLQGCQLSGATLLRFRHNDLADAAAAYDQIPRADLARGARVYLVADSVFSMDGDLFDLPEAHRFCRDRDVFLILDEAHGIACVGDSGRGIEEHFAMPGAVDLLLGTFSKGIPSTGGYAAGSERVVEFLRCGFAAPHTFSSPLSPYHCGAACRTLDILETEPEHMARLRAVSTYLRSELQRCGFDTGLSETPIVPLIIGAEKDTLAVWKDLLGQGYFTGAVVAPAVGLGKGRLRLIANARHEHAEIDAFVGCVRSAMARIGRA